MTYELTPEQARRAIQDHTRRLAGAARAAGAEARVPTAPGWSAADVVEHLGQTQHWVAQILERRITDPAELPAEMVAMPADPDSWSEWLGKSAARAVSAASDAALEAPVWNAAGDERTGGQFWLQSLLNEAVVHGFDAAAAAAGSAAAAADSYGIDAEVAAELITNHLAMLTSPTWAAQRSASAEALRGDGQTLHWHATDAAGVGDWFVERRPDGARWRHHAGPADVSVRGPAGALLLIVTRRVAVAEGPALGIEIDGDVDLVHHWVEHTAHDAG